MHAHNKFKEAGKSHTSASPYNYYGRTHEESVLRKVGPHQGGHIKRKHVVNVGKHGLRSWSDRGHGPRASYKD